MTNDSKTYPALWKGQVVLACRKCQKKLKGDHALRDLANLRKTFKRYNKQHPDEQLHVINVPCLDLCPKDGVTVCNPAERPYRLAILRGEDGIEGLFGES
jgi:predicted metal-binding protein